MSIPNDPAILLSYVNTQLRDFYPTLEEFCKTSDVDIQFLQNKLEAIGYTYDTDRNRFV